MCHQNSKNLLIVEVAEKVLCRVASENNNNNTNNVPKLENQGHTHIDSTTYPE